MTVVQSFVRIAAEWTVAQALEVLDAVATKYAIVHRLDAGRDEFFAYRREELQYRLRDGQHRTVADALDPRQHPALPAVAAAGAYLPTAAVVVRDGHIVGLALPPARGIPEVHRGEEPRSLTAVAPYEVATGRDATLLVKLGGPGSQPGPDGTSVMVAVGDAVKIVLEASGAVALHGPSEATLTVGAEEVVQPFTITGTKAGDGVVTVYAFRNGQTLGSIHVALHVVGEPVDTNTYERPISIAAVKELPDLAITIFEDREANTYKMLLNTSDLRINYAPFGPIKLAGDIERFFSELYAEIEGILRSTDAIAEKMQKLAARGSYLAEKVMPKELRAQLWTLRGSIKSVQIQSAEPWVPWELCKLSGGDPIEEGGFLSEDFEVTRWLLGVPQRADLTMKSLGIVVPQGSGLAAASAEASYLNGLAKPGRTVTAIAPRATDLRTALAGGTYDALHFTGHGQYAATNADRSTLALEGGATFTPMDLSGAVGNLGKAHPFVFLNACEIGRAGQALGGMAGWPQGFLRAGAGAFVGPFWAVADATASVFAQSIYDAMLDQKLTIGAAAHAARAAVRKASDPTWLSYVVYAHPCARVVA